MMQMCWPLHLTCSWLALKQHPPPCSGPSCWWWSTPRFKVRHLCGLTSLTQGIKALCSGFINAAHLQKPHVFSLGHPESECLQCVCLYKSFVCCPSGLRDQGLLSHLLPGAAYLHCIPGWFSQQSPWVRVWRCFTVEGNSLNAFPLTTEKVHAEIERVLGPDCPPTFEDRKNMPFTNAVIHEVQRFVTLLPHVPRCTSADTRFKGYFIPKVRATLQPTSRW